MRTFIDRIDHWIEAIVERACTLLLVLLTLVVLYTVVMRYVFLHPPFWGDTIMVLANVALVLLGVGLAVRRRDLVAMQAAYEIMPRPLAHMLEMLWDLLILGFACVFTWYGYHAARSIPGDYWELGMLPRSYPMMILPVSGVLIIVSCLKVLREDIHRLRGSEPGADPCAS